MVVLNDENIPHIHKQVERLLLSCQCSDILFVGTALSMLLP